MRGIGWQRWRILTNRLLQSADPLTRSRRVVGAQLGMNPDFLHACRGFISTSWALSGHVAQMARRHATLRSYPVCRAFSASTVTITQPSSDNGVREFSP